MLNSTEYNMILTCYQSAVAGTLSIKMLRNKSYVGLSRSTNSF